MAAQNTAPPRLLLRQTAAQLHSTDAKCAAHGSADRSAHGATDSAANGSADC